MSQLSLFNYQILGDAANPKLVFLHGIMGFASNWRTIARQLDDRFQILLFDQRGHGKSFHPSTGYSASDYAGDLLGILDALKWETCSLVGHSMGGRVAVQAASQAPDRVEKLVVVDVGPQLDMQSMLVVEEQLNSVPTPFESRDEAREFFDTTFLQRYGSEMLKQFFYANLEEKADGQFHWKFSKQAILETLWKARTLDQAQQFAELRMPTLLVRGANSTHLPQDMFDEVLAQNPNIQGSVIKGAGHWVHAEKPEQMLEELQRFL